MGVELVEPGIARAGYPIFKHGPQIGEVTSGTMSPTLRKPIALGYVSMEEAVEGNAVKIECRGRKIEARIQSLPFYRR